MTTLQSLLGKHYKWLYHFGHSIRSVTVNKFDSFMWILTTFVLLGANLVVYFILDKENFSENYTYLIIGTGFLINSLAEYSIGDDIRDGKISSRLLRPTNVLGYYFVRSFGSELIENLAKIVLYSTVIIVTWSFVKFPTDLMVYFNFGISLIIAFVIQTFLSFITGFSAFWLNTYYGTASFVGNFQNILAGNTFKLDLFVKIFSSAGFILYLPFAFTFYRPMQIFLGKDTFVFSTLLQGFGWCFVFWILTRLVYKAGLKRNEAVGL